MRDLESCYSPISPKQAAFCSLAEKVLQMLLLDTGLETLFKTMYRLGEFPAWGGFIKSKHCVKERFVTCLKKLSMK
jgi:hypothetical protein